MLNVDAATHQCSWTPPPTNSFKLNFDVVVSDEEVRIDAIVQDHNGKVLTVSKNF